MAADRSHLQDADTLLFPTVCRALDALSLEECDVAAVRLAKEYARVIDEAGQVGPDGELLSDPAVVLEKIGPKLLTVLESLGATPGGRSKAKQTGAAVNGALASFRRNAG